MKAKGNSIKIILFFIKNSVFFTFLHICKIVYINILNRIDKTGILCSISLILKKYRNYTVSGVKLVIFIPSFFRLVITDYISINYKFGTILVIYTINYKLK